MFLESEFETFDVWTPCRKKNYFNYKKKFA